MPLPAQVLHPDGFHGTRALRGRRRGRGSFFEGWYVKLVSPDLGTRLAVIPGVFLSEDASIAESFVQVLDGITGGTAYHAFPLADFHAHPGRFDVRVGGNRFDERGVHLDLPGLAGDIRFGPLARWPVTLRAPGAMGWYAWVPTMECYHGVVSFDHRLDGWVDMGAGRLDVTGGRGYVEKDWGTAFPEAYVWVQSNHFEAPGVSLMASTALIPWRGSAFRGAVVALRLPSGPAAGLHRFATYTRARTTHLAVDDHMVRMSLVAPGGDRLDLRALVGGRTTGLLHAPVRTQMHQRVAETLDGEVSVRLSQRHGRILFEGAGRVAGVEVHGPVDRLVATPGKETNPRPGLVRTWDRARGRLAPRRGSHPAGSDGRLDGQG